MVIRLHAKPDMRDLKFAIRLLWRSPAFTIVALLALALGIGANTAIFTVVYSVLLKPLNYAEPDRLVLVQRDYTNDFSPSLSAFQAREAGDGSGVFQHWAMFDVLGVGANLTGEGEPERVSSIRVSQGYFRTLGVMPARGRGFSTEENTPNGPRTAVLSDALWQRRYGSDPGIIGRKILVGGSPVEIVGVMPPAFQSEPKAELLLPLQEKFDPAERAQIYFVIGRLKPGLTLQQADRQMRNFGLKFRAANAKLLSEKATFSTVGYQEFLTGDIKGALLVLLAAVGCVLLIACANVANLLLARAAARTREIAIRSSLGAGTARIVRQLLGESLLLSLVGGALGLLVADVSLKALMSFETGLPAGLDVSIQWPVLLFTFVLSAVTGILFGLVPAWQATRTDLNTSLRESGNRSGGSASRGRVRKALVVSEIACAVVLLAGAVLLLRTFQHLRSVQPGFDARNVLTFQMAINDRYNGTPQISDLLHRLEERIQAVPGVERAAVVTNVPMEIGPDLPYEVVGRSDNNDEGHWRNITPGFFQTLRTPIVQGRAFNDRDTNSSEPVIIVNDALVRAHFKGRSPIGERILIGRQMGEKFLDRARVIVGVSADIRERGLDREVPHMLYIPVAQTPETMIELNKTLLPFSWLVRTVGPPMETSRAVRDAILSVDRDQPVSNLRPLEVVLAGSLARRQFNTVLLSLFAGLALVLAAVGIYGVLSYAVRQRTGEIGVRLALGANRGDVIALVLRESLRPALLGIALGVAAAVGLTRFMESMVYGVPAHDPLSFLAVILLLLLVSVLASIAPALRAMRIDPVQSLRAE